MSTEPTGHLAAAMRHELQGLRNEWWWFLLLGIALVVLGTASISCAPFVSVLTVVFFGFLLLAGGIAQVVSSFWSGRWSAFLLHLLIGILYVIAGYFIIDHPIGATLAITLFVAAMLIVSGMFRIVAALTLRFSNWGWPLLNGVISLLLGLYIYKQRASDDLVVIGIFVGIELLFNGWAWIMLALTLRQLPKDA